MRFSPISDPLKTWKEGDQIRVRAYHTDRTKRVVIGVIGGAFWLLSAAVSAGFALEGDFFAIPMALFTLVNGQTLAMALSWTSIGVTEQRVTYFVGPGFFPRWGTIDRGDIDAVYCRDSTTEQGYSNRTAALILRRKDGKKIRLGSFDSPELPRRIQHHLGLPEDTDWSF